MFLGAETIRLGIVEGKSVGSYFISFWIISIRFLYVEPNRILEIFLYDKKVRLKIKIEQYEVLIIVLGLVFASPVLYVRYP